MQGDGVIVNLQLSEPIAAMTLTVQSDGTSIESLQVTTSGGLIIDIVSNVVVKGLVNVQN